MSDRSKIARHTSDEMWAESRQGASMADAARPEEGCGGTGKVREYAVVYPFRHPQKDWTGEYIDCSGCSHPECPARCGTCGGRYIVCPNRCKLPVEDVSPAGSFKIVCSECGEPVEDCPDCAPKEEYPCEHCGGSGFTCRSCGEAWSPDEGCPTDDCPGGEPIPCCGAPEQPREVLIAGELADIEATLRDGEPPTLVDGRRMAEEIRALRARLTQVEDGWERSRLAFSAEREANDRLARQLREARKALRRYGDHKMRCVAWGPGGAVDDCTCGLMDAIARAALPEQEQADE